MTVVARSESIVSPRQNWILNAGGDWFWIIGTPVLALAWALLTLLFLGPVWVISIFVVFNASHHVPTFLRIYGTRISSSDSAGASCWGRYWHSALPWRWSLFLSPRVGH